MFRSIRFHQIPHRLFHCRLFAGPQQRNPRLRQGRRFVHLQLEGLEERVMPTIFNIANGDVTGLISAINQANTDTNPDTINLAAGGTYTLTVADNSDNGLPIITAANLTINGNGATIQRSSDTPFRILDIGNSSTTTLNELTITGGYKVPDTSENGGGIYVSGTLNLNNSTVSNNTAVGFGGGIYVIGTLNMINSTISGNTASVGGGLFIESSSIARIANSTIASNTSSYQVGSGGIEFNGATLSLVNSIVADNQNSYEGGSDLEISSQGTVNAANTLIQNLTIGTINGTNVNNKIGSQYDPQLGPLQNNGGPTATMAIPTTSPAFAAGDPNLLPPGVTTDQRGFARVVNGELDMGAFQIQAGQIHFTPPPLFFSSNDQSINLSVTVTAPGPNSVNEGDVTFTVFGQTLPPANVVNGVASTTLTIPGGTAPGTYTITAVFDPPHFRGSTFTSTLTVDPLPTRVSVANVTVPFTSADPMITLNAAITTPEGVVNEGQVQFVVTNSSGAPVGQAVTANVQGGQASALFAVPPATPLGAYTITANYSDPAGNFFSSSGTGTLNIVTSPTTATITNVSIVYDLFSEHETLTAVVFNALGQTVDEGFVTFSDGGQSVTVPIINSLATATLNIPIFFENPNAHPITITYSSNTNNFSASISQSVIGQTTLEWLIQVFVFLEYYLPKIIQNAAASNSAHSAGS